MRTIIELYNAKVKIECATQEEANLALAFYADTDDEMYQNLQQRTVTVEDRPTPEIVILQKTQREKYDFLKNLMLDFAGELAKNPAEAFAVKSDVEDLKFWAELGAAEAVMFTLSSIEDNAIFTPEVKMSLIGKIQNFLET